MKLTIQAEEKDIFGLYHLSVLIDSKEYSFHLASEWALRQVKIALKRRRPGRAINVLKQFNLMDIYKEEKNGEESYCL